MDNEQHRMGVQLFREGRLKESVLQLARAIEERESSECWNDWATAELACGRAMEAEQGYRRALELDPQNAQAAANLGILLMGLQRVEEAAPLLERGAEGIDEHQRAKVAALLTECRERLARRMPTCVDDVERKWERLDQFLQAQRETLEGISARLCEIESKLGQQARLGLAPSGFSSEAEDARLELPPALELATDGGCAVLKKCSRHIVEIPFVHRHLPYPFCGRVLEVGCRGSQILFELSCLGFETWGVDLRPPWIAFPGAQYLQADIKQRLFVADSFDVVIACSTIEYIGLASYGNQLRDEKGDLHALQEILRILKSDGRLILTVSFGQRGSTDLKRVYDHASLLELLANAGFGVETEDYWKQDGLVWKPSHWSEAESVDSLSEGVRALACVVARRASVV